MPTGESEYRDIISWKNKQKNQWAQREMEEDGANREGRRRGNSERMDRLNQSAARAVWVCATASGTHYVTPMKWDKG